MWLKEIGLCAQNVFTILCSILDIQWGEGELLNYIITPSNLLALKIYCMNMEAYGNPHIVANVSFHILVFNKTFNSTSQVWKHEEQQMALKFDSYMWAAHGLPSKTSNPKTNGASCMHA